jgi:hypothetical protein
VPGIHFDATQCNNLQCQPLHGDQRDSWPACSNTEANPKLERSKVESSAHTYSSSGKARPCQSTLVVSTIIKPHILHSSFLILPYIPFDQDNDLLRFALLASNRPSARFLACLPPRVCRCALVAGPGRRNLVSPTTLVRPSSSLESPAISIRSDVSAGTLVAASIKAETASARSFGVQHSQREPHSRSS